MGHQEPRAGGSSQLLRVGLGKGTRGPGHQNPGRGQDRMGCVREVFGRGEPAWAALQRRRAQGPPCLGSTRPWVPPAWPAWVQRECCSLPCTLPFRTAFGHRPLSSPFSGLLRSEGRAHGGQRPPGAAG